MSTTAKLAFLIFVVLLIALCATISYGQTTAVTATITDSDAQTWNNGIWNLAFAPNPSQPTISLYNINGTPLSPSVMVQNGTMNGSGTLSFSAYQNGVITPTGSSWNLTVCPNASAKCTTYNFTTGLLASLDLSSVLSSQVLAPRFLAISGTYGYLDVEASVQLVPGSTYYNVTSSCQRVWSGTSWGCASTGAGIYLPLTGGTLTGGLIGTIANFTDVTANSITNGRLPLASDTSYTGLNVYADSFGAGYGATIHTVYGYAYLLQADFGGTFNNYAVSGSTAEAAAVTQVFPHGAPSYTSNPATVIQLGTNDAACGVTAGCENNYMHTTMANIAFRAIPREYQIQFGSAPGATCTTTGTWTADNTLATGLALQSIVPGSTITCNTLSASPVFYLAWMANGTSTASAGLSLNSGVVTDTLNAFGYNGVATSPTVFANRYTISGGVTTFRVSVNTAGAGNPFSLVFAGSPILTTSNAMANFTENPPRVFLVGVGYLPGFTTPDSSLAAYDTINYNLATQFLADGNFVKFINIRNPTNIVSLPNGTLNNTTDYAGGTLPNGIVCPATADIYHPANCGHQHIRDAVVAVARPTGASGVSVGAAYSVPNNVLMTGVSSYILKATDGIVQLNGSSSTLDMTATGFPGSYGVMLINYGVGLPTLIGAYPVPPPQPASGTENGGELVFWNSAGWRLVADHIPQGRALISNSALSSFQTNAATMDFSSGAARFLAAGPNATTPAAMQLGTLSSDDSVFFDAFDIDTSGNLTLGVTSKTITIRGTLSGIPKIIGSGTATMTTAAITAPACGATVTVPQTGVLSTDTIKWSFNSAPSGTNTGIVSWPTAGNVNFAYCPGVTETPTSATLNWSVTR